MPELYGATGRTVGPKPSSAITVVSTFCKSITDVSIFCKSRTRDRAFVARPCRYSCNGPIWPTIKCIDSRARVLIVKPASRIPHWKLSSVINRPSNLGARSEGRIKDGYPIFCAGERGTMSDETSIGVVPNGDRHRGPEAGFESKVSCDSPFALGSRMVGMWQNVNTGSS